MNFKRWIFSILWLAKVALPEEYSQWAHSTTITLNTTANGANISSSVLNFPILLRLGSFNFNFSEAGLKGADIRFSKPDGSPLDYQIERWNDSLSLAEIWIRMDTVIGNASTQSLRMYWGKPGAVDSSKGAAVFDSANGFVGVWHLGGPNSSARKNSVAGGSDAIPFNFEGVESVPGMIGLADSLDATLPGEYLDIGNGYADFTTGFTYSIWTYPTAQRHWARLLDIGNGQGADNISFTRGFNTQNIILESWTGNIRPPKLQVDSVFPINEWQHYTATITGKKYAIYRNGILVGSLDSGNAITKVERLFNFLGRSNWGADEFYQGLYDEPVMSRVTRSADWIKLSYANQKAQQSLVTVTKTSACQLKFSVPADTVVHEASSLKLQGQPACATEYGWAVVSGPAPKILDPSVQALQILLPRISKDTSIVYQFKAKNGSVWDSHNVKVSLQETIPDPIFTLPTFDLWNGSDSLLVAPIITNLAAIQASSEPNLTFQWILHTADIDTVWGKETLILTSAKMDADIHLDLCLENNGPQVCASTLIKARHSAGVYAPTQSTFTRPGLQRIDAKGRKAFPRTQTDLTPSYP